MEHVIKPIRFSTEDVTKGHRDGRIICLGDMQLQLTYIFTTYTG